MCIMSLKISEWCCCWVFSEKCEVWLFVLVSRMSTMNVPGAAASRPGPVAQHRAPLAASPDSGRDKLRNMNTQGGTADVNPSRLTAGHKYWCILGKHPFVMQCKIRMPCRQRWQWLWCYFYLLESRLWEIFHRRPLCCVWFVCNLEFVDRRDRGSRDW